MAWTPIDSLQLTRDWQYTDPIPTGTFFRLKQTEAPNGGLFVIAQAELVDGKLSIIDSQVLAVEKDVTDAIKLSLPGCFTERRIAIKKLPYQPTLEEEVRRLFLPRILQDLQDETIRIISRSKWVVDIEVSDSIESSTSVNFAPIQTRLDEISTKIDNLQSSGSSSSPTANTRTLTYASDGDTNGVAYWIGTNYGTEPWTNPHTANRVTVTIINSNPAGGSPEVMVDRSIDVAPNSNSSSAIAEAVNSVSSISIDLGINNLLLCNYYSIRARVDYDNYLPRDWKLQGSNDNSTWIDLDTQINNTSLKTTAAWLSIPISNASTKYRYFRIAITNTTGGNDRCFLSEFEFYGTLITKV